MISDVMQNSVTALHKAGFLFCKEKGWYDLETHEFYNLWEASKLLRKRDKELEHARVKNRSF